MNYIDEEILENNNFSDLENIEKTDDRKIITVLGDDEIIITNIIEKETFNTNLNLARKQNAEKRIFF